MSHGNSFQKSEYWNGGFQRSDAGVQPSSKPGVSQHVTWSTGDVPADLGRVDPDRAEAISRAFPGDVCHQGRAGSSGSVQHKDCEGHLLGGSGDVCAQARALGTPSLHQGVCQDGRALSNAQLPQGVCQDGRALSTSHLRPGVCHDDRALGTVQLHPSVCHDDRASGAAYPHHQDPHRSCQDLRPHGGGGFGGGVESIPTSWESGGIGSSTKADLPELPCNASPLQFGDWIHLCGPVMRDLSYVASRWWDLTVRQAQTHYADWKHVLRNCRGFR